MGAVARFTSDNFFEVLDDAGLRYFGALLEPDIDETLTVGLLDSVTNGRLDEVARIERIRTTFWSHIKATTTPSRRAPATTSASRRRSATRGGDSAHRPSASRAALTRPARGAAGALPS